MSLNIIGTTGTNYLLTGSANFVLPTNRQLIQGTAILRKQDSMTMSEYIRNKTNCSIANTINNVLTTPNQNIDLGYMFSDGVRLAYVDNLATLSRTQTINDNGGIVTSAYEGNATFGSLPT